jgi:hypothetical protein
VKVISNKTHKPIKVPLPGGKFLHLGPNKTGNIAERAAEQPSVLRLIKAGEIEVYEEGSQPQTAGAGKSGGGQASTHGHAQNTMMRPKGDR